ncbi:MAG: hypothetical protein U0T68_08450 [Ferruginibacter sp.]
MKKFFIYIILLFQFYVSFAQTDSAAPVVTASYQQVKEFLSDQRKNKTDFSYYRKQLNQWLSIAHKKEPATAVLANDSYLIQVMPLQYDAKGLQWISPNRKHDYRETRQYRNLSFGEQVMSDVISSAAGSLLNKRKSRYHYSAAENKKPYSKPSFLQF